MRSPYIALSEQQYLQLLLQSLQAAPQNHKSRQIVTQIRQQLRLKAQIEKNKKLIQKTEKTKLFLKQLNVSSIKRNRRRELRQKKIHLKVIKQLVQQLQNHRKEKIESEETQMPEGLGACPEEGKERAS